MVPPELTNYFMASAGASAALVGLIFVAISLSPKETVMPGAAPERRAVAGGSFLALVNAFFISLSALNANQNVGWTILVASLICLFNSLWQALPLFRKRKGWRRFIASAVMILLSLAAYGIECYYAVRLLIAPKDVDAINGVVSVLTYVYAIGLLRAWELLGVERMGLGKWLNPLWEDNSAS